MADVKVYNTRQKEKEVEFDDEGGEEEIIKDVENGEGKWKEG